MKPGRSARHRNQPPTLDRIVLEPAQLRCSCCGVTAETAAARPFVATSRAEGYSLCCRLCGESAAAGDAEPDWRHRIIGDALVRCGLERPR